MKCKLIFDTTTHLNRRNRVDVTESHCPIWHVHGNLHETHPNEESWWRELSDQLSLLVDKRAKKHEESRQKATKVSS